MAEKKLSIYGKLLKIQSELKAPKNNYNSFGKYKYRSCEDILEGVKPLLKEVGATLVMSDEIVAIGNRYYLKSTATMTDIDTGETVTNTAYAREPEEKKGMDGSQVTGTSSSYCRKYCLNGLLCIDDTKDSDAEERMDEKIDKSKSKNNNKQTEQSKPVVLNISLPDCVKGDGESTEVYIKEKWHKLSSMNESQLNYVINNKEYIKAHAAAKAFIQQLKNEEVPY